MTTLSEDVQAFPPAAVINISPLGEYGEAANEGGIPKTEWVKEFLPPFRNLEERPQDE